MALRSPYDPNELLVDAARDSAAVSGSILPEMGSSGTSTLLFRDFSLYLTTEYQTPPPMFMPMPICIAGATEEYQ